MKSTRYGHGSTILEGSFHLYDVTISSIPQFPVEVMFIPLNSTLKIDPNIIYFNGSNWNTTQEVKFRAVDDDAVSASPTTLTYMYTQESEDINFLHAAVYGTVLVEENDIGIGACLYNLFHSCSLLVVRKFLINKPGKMRVPLYTAAATPQY